MRIARRAPLVALALFAIAVNARRLVTLELVATGKEETRVQPAARGDLTALKFLLGEWEAIDTPAGERGAFIFSLGVQSRVMTRTNDAVYEAREGRPASRHDDLMVIYVESGTIKADYFDSEQRVIRYVAEPRGDREVAFVSEPKASEPRYRLSYTARADGTLAGRFEIAPPESPDAFKPYLSWTARKRQ